MFPETPEDYYRPIYFEVLDLITTFITDRFNRPGYNVFHNVQNLILKAVQGLDLKCMATFIRLILIMNYLELSWEILRANFTPNQTSVKITDVTEFFKAMTPV